MMRIHLLRACTSLVVASILWGSATGAAAAAAAAAGDTPVVAAAAAAEVTAKAAATTTTTTTTTTTAAATTKATPKLTPKATSTTKATTTTTARAPVKQASALARKTELSDETKEKVQAGQRLNRKEIIEVKQAVKATYIELRQSGVDEISNTAAAAALRNYRLRSKKRTGLIRKRKASLAEVLYAGVSPEEYIEGETIWVYADLVESLKRPVPYEYYDLPGCEPLEESSIWKHREGRNLGSRLQGHNLSAAPFNIRVGVDAGCRPLCKTELSTRKVRWLRFLIRAQYRVQLQLDRLPVLMRSKEYNYAVRGYPIGFQAPPSFVALKPSEFYFFNHLRFVVTYNDKESSGVRITGFDVYPMSIQHEIPKMDDEINEWTSATCKRDQSVVNDPARYIELSIGTKPIPVVYSYEIKWESSALPWTDRWDVYLIGAPDDDLHYFSIVNSLMIVLFLTFTISTSMIRTLRKDIAVYNEMLDSLEDGSEETGWKLVHGDVFRPPQSHSMLLCVLVGNGAQICVAFGLAMLTATLKIFNPVQKGQTLTAFLILYVLCGSVGGYVSSRLYKYTEGKAWKFNIMLTAAGLPGSMIVVFMILNIWLSIAGAATAASFLTIVKLFLLWFCVSSPLVIVGALFGLRLDNIDVPTETNQIARVVPVTSWRRQPRYTIMMGGILPFGSVYTELAFIMRALWLHQIYYVMGFLLAALFILIVICAQVSIVLTYLQLCAEDHRWWWTSFLQCASAGFYLFLYSLWFLASRLDMVGVLPVVVYLTYMGMISICFALVCGSIGFMAAFWFTRIIYGAVKVD